jgi:cyclopropane fatty-acyl-phospholipid synthase-like methyltransferase
MEMNISTKNTDYWKAFWNDKDDPLHSASTDEHYDVIADELKLLVPDDEALDVLELGCGNGAFYERLGFCRSSYVGVDLSEAMIDKFKSDFPKAELYVGSATDFAYHRKFDLIFTNGVMQYLNHADFERHFELAAKMLKPGGRILHASVPWKPLRWAYLAGDLQPHSSAPRVRQMAFAAARIIGLKKDTMGTWYHMSTVREIAKNHGFEAEFFGSLYYPYRFHTLLTLV